MLQKFLKQAAIISTGVIWILSAACGQIQETPSPAGGSDFSAYNIALQSPPTDAIELPNGALVVVDSTGYANFVPKDSKTVARRTLIFKSGIASVDFYQPLSRIIFGNQTANGDTAVKMYTINVNTGGLDSLRACRILQTGPIFARFLHNGEGIVTGGDERQLIVWYLNGEFKKELRIDEPFGVRKIAVHYSNAVGFVVRASRDCGIISYDGRTKWTIPRSIGNVTAVHFDKYFSVGTVTGVNFYNPSANFDGIGQAVQLSAPVTSISSEGTFVAVSYGKYVAVISGIGNNQKTVESDFERSIRFIVLSSTRNSGYVFFQNAVRVIEATSLLTGTAGKKVAKAELGLPSPGKFIEPESGN